MSTERVNLICQSCAEYNGGKWRNTYADPLLGKCDVCKKVTIITNVHHYHGIHPEKHFLLPIETPKNKTVDPIETPKNKTVDPKVNSNLDLDTDSNRNSNLDLDTDSNRNSNLDLDTDSNRNSNLDPNLNVNANRKTSNKPKNKVLT